MANGSDILSDRRSSFTAAQESAEQVCHPPAPSHTTECISGIWEMFTGPFSVLRYVLHTGHINTAARGQRPHRRQVNGRKDPVTEVVQHPDARPVRLLPPGPPRVRPQQVHGWRHRPDRLRRQRFRVRIVHRYFPPSYTQQSAVGLVAVVFTRQSLWSNLDDVGCAKHYAAIPMACTPSSPTKNVKA